MGLATALALATDAARAAAPADAQPRTPAADGDTEAAASMIEVHVGESITRADALSEKIHDDVLRVLRAHRIDLDAQDRTRLSVGVGGESYAYRVNMAVFRDGSIVAPAPQPWTCECTNEELLVEISQHVVDLLPVLRGDETPPSSSPTPAPSDASSTPPQVELTPSGKLRPIGKAGVGLLVGGVVLAGTGAALVGVGSRDDRSSDALEGSADRLDLRPGGYVLLGVGVAVLVTGAVLLGVDRRHARRRQLVLAPAIGPRTTGFSLMARF